MDRVREKINMVMIFKLFLAQRVLIKLNKFKAESKRHLERLELKTKFNKSRIYSILQGEHYMKFIKKLD